MKLSEWNFAKAILRQLYTAEVASFYIVQEQSTNVLNDITVKDTDGTIYEIKDQATAALHEEMLKTHGLSFHYVPRETYVWYEKRSDGDDTLYHLSPPVE